MDLETADFFATDWRAVIAQLADPILIVGNPPWVTNSELGALRSQNLPHKVNCDRHRGIDAVTGRSNFDISEWMLTTLIDALEHRAATLAILCKTSVARKVLAHAWGHDFPIGYAAIHGLDAMKHFRASVDACLLIVRTAESTVTKECGVFESLDAKRPVSHFGWRDGELVSDAVLFDRWKGLAGAGSGWRSGVKHDCSKVLELRREGPDRYRNGLGETLELESSVVYPLVKSSDLASRRPPTRWLLVPQLTIASDTAHLQSAAPMAWAYLTSHAERLDNRASSVYRNRPRFCVFGIGEYSFAPWKVAISGFYKRLVFSVLGPVDGKPVLCDDTGYFFACRTEEEGRTLQALLDSRPALEFLSARVFWDSKRPITARLLNSLDLMALGKSLGFSDSVVRTLAERQFLPYREAAHQAMLF